MNNTNKNIVIEISCADEMNDLVRALTANGYEVRVSPAFEKKEDVEARFNNRVPAYYKPHLEYWLVEIIGRVDMPEYKKV